MATNNLPYVTVPGTVTRFLEKIKTAATPEVFNHDFLANTLGFKGGNYRTFIPWAKKIGFINSDGSPSSLYKQFRNPTTSKASLGEALRKGYSALFTRDENCDKLDKTKLKGLVMEITGEPHDSGTLSFMINSFWNAKELAEFNGSSAIENENDTEGESAIKSSDSIKENGSIKKVSLGLNYSINLVLPKTDDPSIYNAIFKTLKENLLN
jgi:Family of unknown function (DUF5343)